MTRVLLTWQSTKFTLPERRRRASVRFAVENDPAFVGFSELGDNDDRAQVEDECARLGYRLTSSNAWEPGVAVREDVELVEGGSGAVFVHGGSSNVPGKGGGFRPRHIVYVRGLIGGSEDLDLTVHAGHSITYRGGTPERQKLRGLMADAFGRVLTDHGEGPRLAVGMGDLNEADRPGAETLQYRILAEHGLETVWDDLGRYPDTFDSPSTRAIDVVFRRVADRRLSFVDGRSVDAPDSDHYRVEVDLEIEPRPVPKPVEHVCPVEGCGLIHVPPLPGR